MNVIAMGAGGHCSVVLDILENMIATGYDIKIKGLLDDNLDLCEFRGYKVLDRIDNVRIYNDENTFFIITIGNNEVRRKIALNFKELRYLTAIHPSAIIGKDVYIDNGSVIMPKAVINANSTIGSHVIINTGAIIEHDNIIGSFSHISPGATLCGGVNIGEGCHIGANSTIIQYKTIGQNSIIGAGSVVIKNITSNVTAVGTPTRIIRGDKYE
ncbi:MAG: acetyltransferase [Peptostreptococcaceae bacterium]